MVDGTILSALGVAKFFLVRIVTFGALNVKIKLRFEVEDHIGAIVFVTLDREVQKL
ncbi:hypothetical protein MKW98_012012, partial [Papaver atlanticum]